MFPDVSSAPAARIAGSGEERVPGWSSGCGAGPAQPVTDGTGLGSAGSLSSLPVTPTCAGGPPRPTAVSARPPPARIPRRSRPARPALTCTGGPEPSRPPRRPPPCRSRARRFPLRAAPRLKHRRAARARPGRIGKKPNQPTSSPDQTHKQRQLLLRHGNGKTVFKSGLRGRLSPPNPVVRRDSCTSSASECVSLRSVLEMHVWSCPSQRGEHTAGRFWNILTPCPGRER